MHPLQHDRQILLACIKELVDLAESLTHPTYFYYRSSLIMESARISERLRKVQEQIEELDID